MKRFFFITLIVLACQISHAANLSTTMNPVMENAKELVKYIEDDLEMEIVRMEFDILRTTKTTTRILSSGWTYCIIAFGDFRFKDIDVKVYRNVGGNWEIVEKDADASAIAVVTIEPQNEGEYMIEISAYSFESGYDVGHYGLIIAHE